MVIYKKLLCTVKRIAIFFLLFASLALRATSPVSIQVFDENMEPLTGVKIIEITENQTLYTDFEGLVNIQNLNSVKKFIIEMPGYHSALIQIRPDEAEQYYRLVLLPLGQ